MFVDVLDTVEPFAIGLQFYTESPPLNTGRVSDCLDSCWKRPSVEDTSITAAKDSEIQLGEYGTN